MLLPHEVKARSIADRLDKQVRQGYISKEEAEYKKARITFRLMDLQDLISKPKV